MQRSFYKEMKIIVVSDTHGNFDSLNKIIIDNIDAQTIIHLGDGQDDAKKLINIYPNKNIIRVMGNCDNDNRIPTEYEGNIGNKKIFASHGHLYNVKLGLLNIFNQGSIKNADIILFGHTHIPLNIFYNNRYIVNPGSLKNPPYTYAILNIDNDNVSIKINTL